MHVKPSKRKQKNPNKQPTSPRPWPDFPKQLLTIIGKQSNLMKRISVGGVTKSWGVPKKYCNPNGKEGLPQLYENGDDDKYQRKLVRLDIFSISFYDGSFWWVGNQRPPPSQDPDLHFVAPIVGQFDDLVLVRSVDNPSEYYFRDPVHSQWGAWYLPKWDSNVPFKQAAMSSDLNGSNCVLLVVTGIHDPAFVFREFKEGKNEWSTKKSEIVDPYSSSNKQLMQFTSVIGYKGKFYALSLQGSLAVIEVSDSQLRITRLGSSRAIPSLPSTRFREYLVESEGKILLIFLVSRKSCDIVDDVEIYQLEFERHSWVKMAGLGNRTLFVGKKCCIVVNASKVGCKGNYVYFTHQRYDDDWWVYDMDKNNISLGWVPAGSSMKSPVWDELNSRRIGGSKEALPSNYLMRTKYLSNFNRLFLHFLFLEM